MRGGGIGSTPGPATTSWSPGTASGTSSAADRGGATGSGPTAGTGWPATASACAAEQGPAGRTRPDLILLDLNRPRKDGREVLAEVKADATTTRIPIIALTTSAADEDILSAYNSHVNAYVQKPIDFDQFIRAVRSIEEFWLSIVRLPDGSNL